jgi:hypothetical protein
LGLRIRNQLAGRRDFRQPHVEEILFGVIILPDTARQQPDSAEPNSFTSHSRRAEAYDVNHV